MWEFAELYAGFSDVSWQTRANRRHVSGAPCADWIFFPPALFVYHSEDQGTKNKGSSLSAFQLGSEERNVPLFLSAIVYIVFIVCENRIRFTQVRFTVHLSLRLCLRRTHVSWTKKQNIWTLNIFLLEGSRRKKVSVIYFFIGFFRTFLATFGPFPWFNSSNKHVCALYRHLV